MAYYRRNKNELLVLTGAVYAFVAYLTAFTLEIVFIIDLAKQTNEHSTLATIYASNSRTNANNLHLDPNSATTLEQARLALESMRAHTTLSCLTIAILYFASFIASLILIVALIIKSTSMILVWICITATLYLPEFTLIIYVVLYTWGIETRNGRVELIFYILRATLNVSFALKAYRLFKNLSHEKNFFRLKPGSSFEGYDSPYFIGDSLSTTINPVFTSNLSLNRCDRSKVNLSRPPSRNSEFNQDFYTQHGWDGLGDSNGRYAKSQHDSSKAHSRSKPINKPNTLQSDAHHPGRSTPSMRQQTNTALSIGDEDSMADYEMDLEYRTLTNQRKRQNQHSSQCATGRLHTNDKLNPIGEDSPRLGLSRGSVNLSYSTQSLNRCRMREMDFASPEQVLLKPLGHLPYEYLNRLGSSNNLTSNIT